MYCLISRTGEKFFTKKLNVNQSPTSSVSWKDFDALKRLIWAWECVHFHNWGKGVVVYDTPYRAFTLSKDFHQLQAPLYHLLFDHWEQAEMCQGQTLSYSCLVQTSTALSRRHFYQNKNHNLLPGWARNYSSLSVQKRPIYIDKCSEIKPQTICKV